MSNLIQSKQNLDALLTKQVDQVKILGVSGDLVKRVVLTEVSKNPALLRCTQESVLSSIMSLAQAGLVPDSVNNLAYLIPRGSTCGFIIGYKGLMKLARDNGITVQIPRLAFENDEFWFTYGSDEHIHHSPAKSDPGEMTHAYCIAEDGGVRYMDVMRRDEIDKIMRKATAGKKSSPWLTDYHEMAKKTVLRRMLKYLDTSGFIPPGDNEEEPEIEVIEGTSETLNDESSIAALEAADESGPDKVVADS